jgi:hypothetical protein
MPQTGSTGHSRAPLPPFEFERTVSKEMGTAAGVAVSPSAWATSPGKVVRVCLETQPATV